MVRGTRSAHVGGPPARRRWHPLKLLLGCLAAVTVLATACSGTPAEDPEPGPFTTVAAGGEHSCALQIDRTVVCWGSNASGQADAPDGEFRAVAAGGEHSCALQIDRTVVCWGSNASGQADAPDGEFRAVAAGGEHSCALRTDRTAVCWGNNRWGQRDAPGGTYTRIAAGDRHSCAIRGTDHAAVCWGDDRDGQAEDLWRFTSVQAGESHSCGIRTDRTIQCWGDDSHGQSQAPTGEFRSIAAGGEHSCGVRTDGEIRCWGDDDSGQSEGPEGIFTAVSVGERHSCGLRVDGTVECWGIRWSAPPPGARHVLAGDSVDPANCRPYGVPDQVTAGFPLPRSALKATGKLRVAVLFVDFSDAAADYPVSREAGTDLALMAEALESSSYGRLDVEFVVLDRWLRAEERRDYYLTRVRRNEGLYEHIATEAVRLADPHFDFGGIDAVMVVMPSAHFVGGNSHGQIETAEGTVEHSVRVNAFPRGPLEGSYPWGWVAAHEFLHLLGLLDMYLFDPVELPPTPEGEAWNYAAFGFMVLHSRYRVPVADLPPSAAVYGADGSRLTYGAGTTALEMLAWSRWQLGWLDDDQILCIREPYARVTLAPVAEPGGGVAMAAVPLSDHEVLVLESRRQTGLDAAFDEPLSGGRRIVQPALLNEGVLVYTVDASIGSGDVPIRLLDDAGDLVISGYPVLAVGDSVTLRGYRIDVVDDDGDTHTVTITRTGDG